MFRLAPSHDNLCRCRRHRNYFENDINESVVLDIAGALVSSGLRDLGYVYLNLDAGVWSPNRTSAGEMQPDISKFPSGIKSLADKLHAQKLKLGLYTNLGTAHATCGRIGAYGRYAQDAKTMAGYGVDFLKVDYCSYDPAHQNAHAPAGGWVPTIPTQLASWQQLRDALNATGRQIYTEFCPRSYDASSCATGHNCLVPPNKTTQDCNPGSRCINDGPPAEWDAQTRKGLANAILTEYGNSHDSWESAMSNLDALVQLRPTPDVDGPGFFSDGDMLQTCNFVRPTAPHLCYLPRYQ